MNIAIKKIQHVGIPTIDLEKSKEFYKSIGFEKVMSSSFEYNGEKGEVVMMKSGEVLIEIYRLPDSELPEIKKRTAGSIDHIAFDVEDVDHVFDNLKQRQFNILENEPVSLPFWKNGCRYFNILGPNGERIEFNQIL
ncbi:VOC family protein [Ascidiimonas sp. W6]|uniref:VOC family protein n=1 Tax=Ascidiimonas meishanensis TaxID=3128903 RepID=UPI0030EC68CD